MTDAAPVASTTWAVVVAGGSGSRFGGTLPKQYSFLGDRRVLDWSLGSMRRAAPGGVVLVVPPDRVSDPEPVASVVVAGGDTRSESVRNGLAHVPDDASAVLIHDAARPLVPAAVINALLAALTDGADAAIPGVAIADTVKQVAAGFVTQTLPRTELVAVQTPQAFPLAVIRRAHAQGGQATDDAALVEASGGRVAVVAGSDLLRKVTTAADITFLEQFLVQFEHSEHSEQVSADSSAALKDGFS